MVDPLTQAAQMEAMRTSERARVVAEEVCTIYGTRMCAQEAMVDPLSKAGKAVDDAYSALTSLVSEERLRLDRSQNDPRNDGKQRHISLENVAFDHNEPSRLLPLTTPLDDFVNNHMEHLESPQRPRSALGGRAPGVDGDIIMDSGLDQLRWLSQQKLPHPPSPDDSPAVSLPGRGNWFRQRRFSPTGHAAGTKEPLEAGSPLQPARNGIRDSRLTRALGLESTPPTTAATDDHHQHDHGTTRLGGISIPNASGAIAKGPLARREHLNDHFESLSSISDDSTLPAAETKEPHIGAPEASTEVLQLRSRVQHLERALAAREAASLQCARNNDGHRHSSNRRRSSWHGDADGDAGVSVEEVDRHAHSGMYGANHGHGASAAEAKRHEQRAEHTEAHTNLAEALRAAEHKCAGVQRELRATSARLETAERENESLRGRASFLERDKENIRARNADLETNISMLRRLLMGQKETSSSEQRRTVEEARFWRDIATPELLHASLPPQGSGGMQPQQEPIPLTLLPQLSAAETERLQVRLRKAETQEKEWRFRLSEMKQASLGQRLEMQSRLKQKQAALSERQKHLFGSVRRIKYLLDEKTKLGRLLGERDQYILKLEAKVLHQTISDMNSKAPRHHNCQPRRSQAPTKEQRGGQKSKKGTTTAASSAATATVKPLRKSSAIDAAWKQWSLDRNRTNSKRS